MRTLKFIVDGQTIKRDPDCDFSKIVPGSKGYLRAKFTFDGAWVGCEKIAVFKKRNTTEQHPVQIVNNSCMIPDEVLVRRNFKMEVIGIKPGYRLVTNGLEVKQDG